MKENLLNGRTMNKETIKNFRKMLQKPSLHLLPSFFNLQISKKYKIKKLVKPQINLQNSKQKSISK